MVQGKVFSAMPPHPITLLMPRTGFRVFEDSSSRCPNNLTLILGVRWEDMSACIYVCVCVNYEAGKRLLGGVSLLSWVPPAASFNK